ncbi:MAG: GAF domain-containing protein [Xanthobacteraceae bacterium]
MPLADRHACSTGVTETKQVVHVFDIVAENPEEPIAKIAGARTLLIAPMLKENELIGVIAIYRQEVRPFTDKQIELVKNFAAQAVIAIENTRLLSELRESLQQQTATADVLRVISSSPGELTPVFDAILANATRICEAKFGTLTQVVNGVPRLMFQHGVPAAMEDYWRRETPRPSPRNALSHVVTTGQAAHVADLREHQAYLERDSLAVAGVELGAIRTLLVVPMLKDEKTFGTIGIYRQEVRPFNDKQIELVSNFAAQAAIAIENTRLLNELRQRTTDLTESLEQQTATSEVLSVISSSPGRLESVFSSMLENAVRICQAKFGFMLRYDGDAYHTVAELCDVPAYIAEMRRGPLRPHPESALGRVARTKEFAQISDITAHRLYAERNPIFVAGAELGGMRTIAAVPMLKDQQLIGAITIFRKEVRPFTDKQIALLQNFAAQAVIAIENARLLNELRESLEQQTATADVLRIISTSPGELGPVYDAMLANAVRLCDARFGNIYRCDHDTLSLVASHNTPPALIEARSSSPLRPDPQTPTGRIVTTRTLVHIADLAAEQAYAERKPAVVEAVELGGIRTLLLVPMLKDDELVGVLTIYRQEVRPFTDKQIALMRNFAAQAVIAIKNARLLDDLNKLNQQLEHRVADQVGEIERMGRLRRFLPPQVADLIVASGTEKQLESHRREITALFCDLRGFTGFSESSDPEDVMALLREYHAAIGQIIVKYSGTLERYAGDGVMVVFNDPVPVENPALQAVLMALEMRDAIGALTETWHRWGHDIGFGIGIAHGFATLGTIGFEGRFDYAAIGTVSNVASRLCDEAKPGQILISPRVLTKVENAVTVETVGEFTLKGIRRPMIAYNVLESSPSRLN